MRKLICIVLVTGGLLVLAFHWFMEPESGRSLLLKAIQAHGGEANLARLRVGQIKGTGIKGGIYPLPIAWEESFELPIRLRRVVRPAGAGTRTYLYRDNKCWVWDDNEEAQVTDAEPNVGESMTSFFEQLLDIHKEKVPLRRVEDAEVAGRAVVGFEVNATDDHRQFFFDKETGLLLKLRRHSGSGDDVSEQEVICSGYRDWDGVPLPKRIVINRDGRMAFELTLTVVKLLDHVPDSVFAKP
jgi:hypothetical protein